MSQPETWRSRQTLLPLPPASLVIDMRVDKDDMIERLKVEIADLTNEMKMQETHHWRFLADFLSFWHGQPMSTAEIHSLRRAQNTGSADQNGSTPATPGNGTATSSQADPQTNHFQTSLTGPVTPASQQASSSSIFFDDDVGLRGLSGDQPADVLKQYTDKILDEADRLRNNRTVAVSDLDPQLAGSNARDKAVRIILVTDAEQPDSLASAAAYAEQMRQFRIHRHYQHQDMMLNVTVLCLNASGEPGSTEFRELLWDESWGHFDSLIISERYRHDGVRIAGSTQTYLAELLLYVLLIVPPMPVNLPQTSASSSGQGCADDEFCFPPNTFLVGLATMEHSARWGKHLLNFKVVERSIEMLQHNCEVERERTTNVVRTWLEAWRARVRSLIPHHVPETVGGIDGINQARNVVQPPERVFTVSHFSWRLSKSTLSDIGHYLATLAATYTLLGADQQGKKVLQDALDSIPQIEQHLKAWESKDADQRKDIPLAQTQMEAQRILSHRDFFNGAQGAISRARIQLEELSRAVMTLRAQQRPIDLKARRSELERQGNNKISALAEDIQSLPRAGTLPFVRDFMAWLTLLLLLGMGVVLAFLSMAWLHHALLNTSFTPFFNDLLLYSVSPVALVFWAVLLTVLLGLLFLLGRSLLARSRSAWSVEIGFAVTLLCLYLFGWGVHASTLALITDSVSAALISWLAFLPLVGEIALIILILLVVGEALYFFWWLNHLQVARTRLVHDLNRLHQENIDAVIAFITDTLAFFMLERTELMNERGEPGTYYERLKKLNEHLQKLLLLADEKQAMVRRRLDLSFSETQPGAKLDAHGPWLNLHIRDERLDVETLADGYTRLNERLGQEMEELRELAEQLVRAMGQEQPAALEREFRERSQTQYSIRRYPQVLMATLVATAQRVSIRADTLTSIQPLIARYKALQGSFSAQLSLMKALIDTISHRLTRIMLEPMLTGSVQSSPQDIYDLSIDAFETWGQMLWENQDQELDRALAGSGVMPKLLENQENANFVKRLLALRTSLFGQSVQPGQVGDLFVLIPPSSHSQTFRQSLNLARRHMIEFPDVERLILLYIQRHLPSSSRQAQLAPAASAQNALPPGNSGQAPLAPTSQSPTSSNASAPGASGI
jgi:hypothetical protein